MAYFKEIVKEVKINGKTRQAIDLRAEVITKAKFTINDILPFNNYFKSLETRIKQLEDKLKLGE